MTHDTSKSLLPLLTYIVGMFDPYGLNHLTRVKELSTELAIKAGVTDEQELAEIELAASLHDIGKIGIPDYVRRIPSKFLPVERMMMEQHSVMGFNILSQVANGYITIRVCQIVKHHHENWKGDGYPDRLKGYAIPLGSRIIRICDFFDALTNVRGYQTAVSTNEALKYMEEEQTIHEWADPQLLRLFCKTKYERS